MASVLERRQRRLQVAVEPFLRPQEHLLAVSRAIRAPGWGSIFWPSILPLLGILIFRLFSREHSVGVGLTQERLLIWRLPKRARTREPEAFELAEATDLRIDIESSPRRPRLSFESPRGRVELEFPKRETETMKAICGALAKWSRGRTGLRPSQGSSS